MAHGEMISGAPTRIRPPEGIWTVCGVCAKLCHGREGINANGYAAMEEAGDEQEDVVSAEEGGVMVTRVELGEVIGRVLASKDEDARVCALALQRYLVGEGRVKFDKRSYMRRYMAGYRARLRSGKRLRKKK